MALKKADAKLKKLHTALETAAESLKRASRRKWGKEKQDVTLVLTAAATYQEHTTTVENEALFTAVTQKALLMMGYGLPREPVILAVAAIGMTNMGWTTA
ncbi:hypothetical protein ZWY2020_049725 [Hordeum vulgare]|nr:hypothetical protein ZWY2020_049713 [Hordeum vulgare]KAI4976118.1 hypothetical protein ZWY2020_049725 [Hordeum vulgare]